MKTRSFFKKQISLLFVLGACFSCIKDTDFNQSTSITLIPIMEVNLVEIQETADSFLDASEAEMQLISDLIVLDVFSSNFINDNLIKTELVFEVTNSLNKAFQIKMDFYDPSNVLQYSFFIDIDNSLTNTPLVTNHTEVFEAMSLAALKSSTQLDISIILVSSPTGSVLTADSIGNINLTSKGIFYFELKE
jgi:hypothetical protein